MPALVDSVVGSTPLNKRPLLIANDLEEQFVRRGWPVGMSFGGEAALASQYNVGRDVMREVVRLLEGRNHAKMRRGSRGGLEVVLPELDGLVGRLAGYAHVSMLDDGQIIEAWLVLQRISVNLLRRDPACDWQMLIARVLRDAASAETAGGILIAAANSPLLVLVGQMVAALLPTAASAGDVSRPEVLASARDADGLLEWLEACQTRTAATRSQTRAEEYRTSKLGVNLDSPAMRLVHALMSETGPQDWVRGTLIGNEFDLADRFRTDKSVVRQAIRLMEDAEAARAVPGRGHGLVTQMPSTAPLSRLISAFLVAHQSSVEDAEQLFGTLRIESAALAAMHATIEDNAMLLAMCHDLDALMSPCPVSAFQGFERLQQRATHNRLLTMIIDGIKAFLTWRAARWPMASGPIVEVYRAQTKAVVTAICSGDRKAAMVAEANKLIALREARAQ